MYIFDFVSVLKFFIFEKICEMASNTEPGDCGERVRNAVHDCFMRIMIEHINVMDLRAIALHFNQELIRCCRCFYLVLRSAHSPRLSNPCFFMAAIYHWLIQQHPNADQRRPVRNPEIIERIHASLTSTDESVLRYFMEAYYSVYGQPNS